MSDELSATYRGFDTYTKSDHHSYVKENFKLLGDLIEDKLKENVIPKNSTVLDIGCATGALIGYLSARFPNFIFEGVDVSEELIGIAIKQIPDSKFFVAGINDLTDICNKTYDIVLCIGVLGIFDEDEAKDAFNRMLNCVNPGGLIYVFSQFNEVDVDVMVKYRRVAPESKWGGWGVGWNIYSYRTIDEWLKNRVTKHRFIEFNMPFPLDKQENPVRSWTVEMGDGSLRLTNGLKLFVDLRYLEITV